ncbi:hypothetical protein [Vibrio cholerae]|uniref:hypothetical protein n=1 Tax=Vibrio cholerae TaxID=666 RepID=UPI0004E32FC7|nr:hypothetical protein [Vibrio cholerae]EJL6547710.1 hypothetical protein [Vibrio cholerae]KFE25748.1 hypothetical protein DN30_3590 [Vibrio cholerae]MEB3762959.1 hypothetical protein [Vibrio cholerae]
MAVTENLSTERSVRGALFLANTVFINSKVENKTVFNLSKSPNLAPNTFKNSTASSQFSPKISNQGLRYLFFQRLMVGVFLLLKIVFGQKLASDFANSAIHK